MSEINADCVPQLPTIVDALQHKDGSERDGIEESIENLRKKQSSITNHSRLWNHKYPEFLFLGTASSHPLPIRNVSGILVNIDEENSILFDCGENTYGQLLNFYGQNSVAKILAKIKTIFISHHHSDHHLGLINLLENSMIISKNGRFGGGPNGFSGFSNVLNVKCIPSRCNAAIASRFFILSKPNDKANRLANSFSD